MSIHTFQLYTAIATTLVALLLTGRHAKEQKQFPPPPANAFRLNSEFIIGLWLLAMSWWLAMSHQFVLHSAGAIIGLIGCMGMLWGAFKMNRKVMTGPAPTNKEMRISDLKKARKKTGQ